MRDDELEDIRVHLDLFRAFALAEDPLGFRAERGLAEADIFHMVGVCLEKMKNDASLQKEVVAILAAPPDNPAPPKNPPPPSPKGLGETRQVFRIDRLVL